VLEEKKLITTSSMMVKLKLSGCMTLPMLSHTTSINAVVDIYLQPGQIVRCYTKVMQVMYETPRDPEPMPGGDHNKGCTGP
jgi:hypothetical protein